MILNLCNVFYKFLHVLIVVLHVLTWFTFSTLKNTSSIPDWPPRTFALRRSTCLYSYLRHVWFCATRTSSYHLSMINRFIRPSGKQHTGRCARFFHGYKSCQQLSHRHGDENAQGARKNDRWYCSADGHMKMLAGGEEHTHTHTHTHDVVKSPCMFDPVGSDKS